ncbi:MAG: hypothetical protein ACT4OO_10810 [Nitrospiraceae bacterium]
MRCARCHNDVAKEPVYDLPAKDALLYFGAWPLAHRCLTCGKVSEPAMDQEQQIVKPVAAETATKAHVTTMFRMF